MFVNELHEKLPVWYIFKICFMPNIIINTLDLGKNKPQIYIKTNYKRTENCIATINGEIL